MMFCGVDCDAEKAVEKANSSKFDSATEDDDPDEAAMIGTGILTAVVAAVVTISSLLLVVGRHMSKSKSGHSRELHVEGAAPGNSKIVTAKSTLGMHWDDADVQTNDGISAAANQQEVDSIIWGEGHRHLGDPMDSIFSDASACSSHCQAHLPLGLRQQHAAARHELETHPDREE